MLATQHRGENLERRQRRQAGTQRRKLKIVHEQSATSTRTAPPAETAVEVREWKKSLWNQVAALPDGQRQVLVLRFSEGLRLDEIAEVLDPVDIGDRGCDEDTCHAVRLSDRPVS